MTFTNPVIYADVPDIDVIRVGSDFYMVSTTMHLMPGVPVMKSKDLVNWEIISYVVPEIKDSPAYDLDGGNVYGQGQWPLRFVTTTESSTCSLPPTAR